MLLLRVVTTTKMLLLRVVTTTKMLLLRVVTTSNYYKNVTTQSCNY